MIVGIVGNEAAKFTPATEAKARETIRELLRGNILCSGHCHLGGIDIWAEEEAKEIGAFDPAYIFPPRYLGWDWYKERNLKIAKASAVVYSINVATYPPHYTGLRFKFCYHCGVDTHVKSGGCWTVKQTRWLGKPGHIIVI